jgi:type II secretory pathway pseudopilin PulG
MGTQQQRQSGFTLIEVMLFLGVTAALVIGILVSSGFAINQQRYRDAVNSLQTLLQHQYNETSNVLNDRASGDTDKDRKCDSTGIKTKADDSITDPQDRGTSECLVMGRYFRLSNSKDISVSNVVGYKDPALAAKSDDLAELGQYKFFVSKADTFNSEVAWSATASVKRSSGALIAPDVVVLILRSPLTGANRTFVFQQTSASDAINVATMVTAANMEETKICIDPGPFTISTTLGVIIRNNAANASAIEITGDNQC